MPAARPFSGQHRPRRQASNASQPRTDQPAPMPVAVASERPQEELLEARCGALAAVPLEPAALPVGAPLGASGLWLPVPVPVPVPVPPLPPAPVAGASLVAPAAAPLGGGTGEAPPVPITAPAPAVPPTARSGGGAPANAGAPSAVSESTA